MQTLLQPPVRWHASASVHTALNVAGTGRILTRDTTASVVSPFGHTKDLHGVIGMGSAALAVAVVLPG